MFLCSIPTIIVVIKTQVHLHLFLTFGINITSSNQNLQAVLPIVTMASVLYDRINARWHWKNITTRGL